MKKNKPTAKKLFLNKETVIILNQNQQRNIIGGVTTINSPTTPPVLITTVDTGKIDTGVKSITSRDGH